MAGDREDKRTYNKGNISFLSNEEECILEPLGRSRGQAGCQAGDTHPHDHHLHGDVFWEVNRGPEVHGQGHEEVQDSH